MKKIFIEVEVPDDIGLNDKYRLECEIVARVEDGNWQQVSGEPVAHICILPTKDAGPTKFFTAPSDPRGFPVFAAPQQVSGEPVATVSEVDTEDDTAYAVVDLYSLVTCGDLLFAAPQQREPLTSDVIADIAIDLDVVLSPFKLLAFARAIEAAHNIGEKK
jgi:hypothetical protein